jgi:hypothetical protein
MSELRDVVERAERAVAILPPPPDGFERLTRHRERRRRRNRVLTGVVALVVAAAGTLSSLALLRAVNHTPRQRPAGPGSPSVSPAPGIFPTGRIAQRSIGGEPAQRLGTFWFGVTEENDCLAVKPLAIGPSWTFQDDGHDCVPSLGTESMRVGEGRGAVHRDGDLGPATHYSTVYGLVRPAGGRVDVVWSTGEVSSVVPVRGRFLFVWSGSAWPSRVTAVSAGGKDLASVELTPP